MTIFRRHHWKISLWRFLTDQIRKNLDSASKNCIFLLRSREIREKLTFQPTPNAPDGRDQRPSGTSLPGGGHVLVWELGSRNTQLVKPSNSNSFDYSAINFLCKLMSTTTTNLFTGKLKVDLGTSNPRRQMEPNQAWTRNISNKEEGMPTPPRAESMASTTTFTRQVMPTSHIQAQILYPKHPPTIPGRSRSTSSSPSHYHAKVCNGPSQHPNSYRTWKVEGKPAKRRVTPKRQVMKIIHLTLYLPNG